MTYNIPEEELYPEAITKDRVVKPSTGVGFLPGRHFLLVGKDITTIKNLSFQQQLFLPMGTIPVL